MRRLLALCAIAACGDNEPHPELRAGGDGTVDDRSAGAYTHAIPTLDVDEQKRHRLGHALFAVKWAPPQLGPLFNHDACGACHAGNGRGVSQIGPSTFGSQALIRISLPAGEPAVPGGPVPVGELGTQLQDHAVAGLPEARVDLQWVETADAYGDGEPFTLRDPRIDARRPDGTALPAMEMSYRQAQPMIGLGLLEAIADATLLALADPDDANGDGISGRANMVWDATRDEVRIGRFGHKASVATLREQTGAAFAGDIGIANAVFPNPDGMRDMADAQLDDCVFFVQTLAVPAAVPRDEPARRGRALFDEMGCASCHTPTIETGAHAIAALAHQTIHPYSDLLLHDVGDLLTDGRDDFLATGVEWRTPPLWGIGLAQLVNPDVTFLHDGRARTLAEAILWHGGEAMAAREAFRLAPRPDRDALLAFLATL